MISETESDREDPLPKPNEALEANIEKAIRFWNHPSLGNISSEDKRSFLHARGVTDAEIHKAWERMMETDVPNNNGEMSSGTGANVAANSATPSGMGKGGPNSKNVSTPHTPNLSNPGGPMYPQSSYAQPPYYNNQYSPQEMEEEGPLTLVQGASLVTLGGFIGLTAAAASRWLNGGDFEIFPGPKYASNIAEQRALFLQRLEAEREAEEEEEEDDDEEYDEEDGVDQEIVAALSQQKLIQQVESIAESVRANTAVQERLLKKLTSTGSSITDETMGFLRPTDSKSNDTKSETDRSDVQLIWKELVQIQAELRSLNVAMKGKKSEKRIESTLANLETCIEEINKKMLSPDKKMASPTEASSATPPTIKPATEDSKLLKTTSTVSTEGIEKGMEELQLKKETASTSNSIVDAIKALAEKNEATARQAGCQLLLLYVVNLSGNPTNPRYRKIYTSNESFKKVDQLVGGKELLMALGFEEKGNNLEWLPDGTPAQESSSIDILKKAAEALRILKAGNEAADVLSSALAVFPGSTELSPSSQNETPDVAKSST